MRLGLKLQARPATHGLAVHKQIGAQTGPNYVAAHLFLILWPVELFGPDQGSTSW